MESNAPFFVEQEIIVLTKNGLWLADGIEISHQPTQRLFAKSLRKDKKGYFLQIGHETKLIQVEDTAYFVRRINGSPETGYQLEINDETQEKLILETLSYLPGRLTCKIKSQSEEAKFLHAPYFDILKSLQEDETHYFLIIDGKQINLGSVKE